MSSPREFWLTLMTWECALIVLVLIRSCSWSCFESRVQRKRREALRSSARNCNVKMRIGIKLRTKRHG